MFSFWLLKDCRSAVDGKFDLILPRNTILYNVHVFIGFYIDRKECGNIIKSSSFTVKYSVNPQNNYLLENPRVSLKAPHCTLVQSSAVQTGLAEG